MSQAFFLFWQLPVYTFSYLIIASTSAFAQIVSDDTVNTQVNQNGNIAEITGGETRGSNLFHSFQDFSVPTNNEASFQNAAEISNIFSRVTGGNISEINGAIRANGSSNLFLINPAGIVFGEAASLNIGGSFYGSSASSILFEDGEFSAAALENPLLLTVNAPIGLNFRDNPGDINTNQANLDSNQGQNILLIGGELNIDGGRIGTLGGRIELGSLIESGTVDINNDGTLNFPETLSRGNVSLADSAVLLVIGEEGGSIEINAKNLTFASDSSIFAGISVDSGFEEAQSGDVVFNLTEDLVVNNSAITNSNAGTGNAGDVRIDSRNVTFTNGGRILNFNTGAGNIGDIEINARERISLGGINNIFISGIGNLSSAEATGNTGQINLTARNLSIINGADISSGVLGSGDSGDINLNIADTIRVEGTGIGIGSDGTPADLPSSINSGVTGNGNSGSININTQNLSLNQAGFISVVNAGEGNAGNINIDVNSLSILDGSNIDGSIRGTGTGGNIVINAQDNISVNGTSDFFSAIFVDVDDAGVGEAGNIEINTAQLSLSDAFISADVAGEGNGGELIIVADFIELSDVSLIQANVLEDAVGNGGNLSIETEQLVLSSGSQISASTAGNGNAGNLSIRANEMINLSGVGTFSRSGIFASALNGNGKGGNINISTERLSIIDGATITAGNFSSLGVENGGAEPGTGEPGEISIEANSINLSAEGRIEASTQSDIGEGANINLQVSEDISLQGDSLISAQAINQGNGGNINIDSRFIIAFPNGNNDIIANAEQGNGGNININSESLLGIRESSLDNLTNDINASSEFSLDGNVNITNPDINPVQGATELPRNVVVPEETIAQTCQANQETAAQNNLTVKGKGGIPATPESPLDSQNISIEGFNINSVSTTTQTIATNQGKIQPARGVQVNESGEVILTAHRMESSGDRFPANSINCGA